MGGNFLVGVPTWGGAHFWGWVLKVTEFKSPSIVMGWPVRLTYYAQSPPSSIQLSKTEDDSAMYVLDSTSIATSQVNDGDIAGQGFAGGSATLELQSIYHPRRLPRHNRVQVRRRAAEVD